MLNHHRPAQEMPSPRSTCLLSADTRPAGTGTSRPVTRRKGHRSPASFGRRIALVLGASLAAACSAPGASGGEPASETAAVIPGVEVLLRDSLHLVQGKRVGLITNHSGRDRAGTSTIDLLHGAPDVRLVALFSPEHGIRGAAAAGERVDSSVDEATGLPIHSLYGETRVPSDQMLDGIDVLVYDIQDAGARVYTYVWTMALSAEKAGSLGIPFVVLDRPDPVRGDVVQGNILDPEFRSFVGQHTVALRYGLTPGELLQLLAGEGYLQADVTVVPMDGWRRDMWFDETGIEWVNPSPNLRTVDATLLYTGTVFFEATNLSEGRGTDAPFQLVGAAWLDADAAVAQLQSTGLEGVTFTATERTVEPGQKWGGQTIPMIHVEVTDRNVVYPAAIGLHMLRVIHSLHPDDFEWRDRFLNLLSGTDRTRAAVEMASGVERLLEEWGREAERFGALREQYLVY